MASAFFGVCAESRMSSVDTIVRGDRKYAPQLISTVLITPSKMILFAMRMMWNIIRMHQQINSYARVCVCAPYAYWINCKCKLLRLQF